MLKIEEFVTGNVKNIIYVIIDTETKKAAVIDPAWDAEAITNILEKNNVSLEFILLTHAHYDHTNLVEYFQEKSNCQVYITHEEYKFSKYCCRNLNLLHDMDEVMLGGAKIQCLLTPGHTPGSACFQLGNCLFTGDTLFYQGCGTGLCRGGDYDVLFKSIERLKNLLKNNMQMYPGHITGNSESLHEGNVKENIYFHINSIQVFKKLKRISDEKSGFSKYDV